MRVKDLVLDIDIDDSEMVIEMDILDPQGEATFVNGKVSFGKVYT